MIRLLGTEELAGSLIGGSDKWSYLSDEEIEAATNHLAGEFQQAWLEARCELDRRNTDAKLRAER